MSDNTNSMNAAGGGGGNDKPPKKTNDKSSKDDYKSKIKCKFGKECMKTKEDCPYLHSSTHVPFVKPADAANDAASGNCRYAMECRNKDCKFNHPEGYVYKPSARCKFGHKCEFNDADNDDAMKCNYSHPTDKWWNDLPAVPEFNSTATRGRGGGGAGTSRGGRGGGRGGRGGYAGGGGAGSKD
jgi:uncharacterized membrane protein YgcG